MLIYSKPQQSTHQMLRKIKPKMYKTLRWLKFLVALQVKILKSEPQNNFTIHYFSAKKRTLASAGQKFF